MVLKKNKRKGYLRVEDVDTGLSKARGLQMWEKQSIDTVEGGVMSQCRVAESMHFN